MADVFSVLAADHDRIFSLATQLTGGSSVPPDRPKERKAIADEKRMAPTRPHPHVPASPKLLKTVGPAAAVLDKARNAVIRRG